MMPAKSAAQKRLMDAAAHNPAFAKKVGIPGKVAKEFSSASKGMSFREGGEMKESKAMMKKEIGFMKKAGAPKSMIKHEESEMKAKKMAGGGMSNATGAMRGLDRAAAMSGRTMPATGRSVTAMKSGGLAAGHKSADGIAKKGKTKAKQITMKKGGKC